MMSVTFLLFFILLALMIAVGGKRGAKSFFTLCVNFITLLIMLFLISQGLSPLTVTVICCVLITTFTLFYINGTNKKTVSSLFSVIIVVLFTILITGKMGSDAKIHGFSVEQAESTAYLSVYVNLDFVRLGTCVVLIGLLGAIIDVSISISSSMNEILRNQPEIHRNTLLKSGMEIGKDILGTMTNTLLFAYIGGFMTLIIWFSVLHYTMADILNAKVFVSEVFQILCSGLGIILIIPVTAVIASVILNIKTKPRNEKPEEMDIENSEELKDPAKE